MGVEENKALMRRFYAMFEGRSTIAPEEICAATYDAGPRVERAASLETAEQHLDEAVAIAGAAGADSVARMAHLVRARVRLAREADLDPEFARKFLNFVIAEVIRHHEHHQSQTGA